MENLAALKVIAHFGTNFGEEFESALADGELTVADAPKFFPSLMGVSALIEAVKAKPSLADLSVEQRQELVAYVQADLDLVNDKLELIIESSMNVATSIIAVIEMAKSLKKIEAAPAV